MAFVQQDFDTAYSLLSADSKTRLSHDALVESIKLMHKGGFPSSVEATDYGRMPGQPAISIFVHGKTVSGDIYYRLIMNGTDTTGYAVSGLMRGEAEYPPSMRTPLK